MGVVNFMHIVYVIIIETHTICLYVLVFYLTMKVLGEVLILLLIKLFLEAVKIKIRVIK
jgi:hypothetical protein